MISSDDFRPLTATPKTLLARVKMHVAAIACAVVLAVPAQAQQPPTPAPATPAPAPVPAAPSPAAPAPAQPQYQPSAEWGRLPKMELERQYAGPLQDTIVQRWRDTVDGTVCYLYLPISVQHSPPTSNGFVQYGPNTIGSISCMPGAGGSRSGARAPAR